MSTKTTTAKAKTPAVKKKAEEVKTEGVTTPEEETSQATEPETETPTPETTEAPDPTEAEEEKDEETSKAEENPEPKPEPVKVKEDVIGSLKGGKQVHQKIKTVKVKAMRGPVPHRDLPEDIQKWLKNKGYGTNIYLKPKEWLQAHKVDMKMVEKLKKFINDKYL